jgi:hypothetical protein
MPVVYAFTALIGAVAMPLLTGSSEGILFIPASAVIGATIAPLGTALLVCIVPELDRQKDDFIIEDAT